MDKLEAAKLLNGSEYREEGSPELFKQMKENKLVAVFGASDDLTEFFGAINDEVGAPRVIKLDNKGYILHNKCDDSYCPYYEEIEKNVVNEIYVEFSPKDIDATWKITANFPYEPFNVYEDGELYCQGLVYDLKDFN